MVAEIAAPLLSPDFTTRVLEEIFSHHKDRVHHLTEKYCPARERFVVTSDPGFVFPFEHTVVNGLYSGEELDKRLVRFIKRRLCNRSIYLSRYKARSIIKMSAIREAISDLYDVAYGLGTEFHDVENLRGNDGRIILISPEQGKNFIYIMVDGMSINISDQERFAKSVWLQYAKGMPPKLAVS